MQVDQFLEVITNQFDTVLPFVVYAYPNSRQVIGYLQEDDSIYKVKDFTESGFVFAPFDTSKTTVLMPFDKIASIETSFDDITFETALTVFEISNDKDSHVNLVDTAVREITHSQIDKIVISRIEEVDLPQLNLKRLLKQLFSTNSTAFRYCWYHPKIGLWVGATPETLCKLDGKRFETMSLAGTQLYNDTLDVDWSAKEIEEQQIVTDFITAQLSPFMDNVQVSKTETVRAGNVLHLRTKIRGLLAHNDALKQVLERLHPTPAVCGLPKEAAKAFITTHEAYDRAFYTGYLGELNKPVKKTPRTSQRNIELRAFGTQSLTTQLYVNLRCMQLQHKKALIYVGGGITKDSISELEWEETLNKTNAMKNVLS
jgi:isochorismate synthase